MSQRLLTVVATLTCLQGCAKEEFPPEWPAPPAAYAYGHPGYRTSRGQVLGARGVPVHRRGDAGERSLYIPGGAVCLEWLSRHWVNYRVLEAKRGMSTPVEVFGPIGGVTYQAPGESSLVCDCRLAVALHWAAPHLRAFGVSEVRHAGAYVYRTTRKGRLSLHALGLAIDVRDIRANGRLWTVEKNYYTGLPNGCTEDSPELNRIACRLGMLDLFQELLTPDYDRDHHDHFHLAIAPLW